MNHNEYLLFYKGYDNSVYVTLSQNGVAFDYTEITKVTLKFDDNLDFDSINDPTLFDVEPTGIRLKLGNLNLNPGKYQASLIIHTASWPNGVVWGNRINIKLFKG